MIKVLTINRFKSLNSSIGKKYIKNPKSEILDDWMIAEVEKTIDRINKGEEKLIPFEEWQEEMRREYNVQF